ncbi:MAG: DUF4381 domain-containing protein [Alphaproteobacteria bacterium]|nr:DUF4381 domain-containing protein [Alphaproteobacteria bacterium]
MNNLPEIRDIYIPDGVSFFPIAYGWWVLLIGSFLLFFMIKLLLLGIKKSKKHYALKTLKNINIANPVTAAIEMSELLRRICTVKYKEAAALYGQEWIDFLNKHTEDKLSGDEAKLLMYAPFMKEQNNTFNETVAENLKAFCKNWIGANL